MEYGDTDVGHICVRCPGIHTKAGVDLDEAAPKSQRRKSSDSILTGQEFQDKKLLYDPGYELTFLPLPAQAAPQAWSTRKIPNLTPGSANLRQLSLSATHGRSSSPQSHILSGHHLAAGRALLHLPLPVGTSVTPGCSVFFGSTLPYPVQGPGEALLSVSSSLSRAGSEGGRVPMLHPVLGGGTC